MKLLKPCIAKTTIVLVLICLTGAAEAQISPNKPEQQLPDKIIKMSKYPNADISSKLPAVASITIVQALRDSTNFGYVQKGLDGQVAFLVTPKPVTTFFQEHIDKMYKNDFKKKGVNMLWILKDLRVGERTNFSKEYAYTRFNADAFVSAGGNKYKFVTRIDTVFVVHSSGDVTAWHGQHIENAFKTLLKQTLLKMSDPVTDPDSSNSIEEIIEKERTKFETPILTDSYFNQGAYTSFEEFLQNKPSITNFEPVIIGKYKVKFTTRSTRNITDTINIWGLCKKGEIYKHYNDELIPIEKSGNGFIISWYAKTLRRRNSNFFFSSLVGGLAGGLLNQALSGNMLQVTTIPYITSPLKQPIASCIDMKTGNFTF